MARSALTPLLKPLLLSVTNGRRCERGKARVEKTRFPLLSMFGNRITFNFRSKHIYKMLSTKDTQTVEGETEISHEAENSNEHLPRNKLKSFTSRQT